MFKAVLLVCVQALLIRNIAGQCIGARLAAAPMTAAPCAAAPIGAAPCAVAGPLGIAGSLGNAGYGGAYAYDAATLSASNGGGLAISSGSPISPNGISVVSENSIAGGLMTIGALPFLGTVALEEALPTAGAGTVNYGCGNGAVAILEETGPDGIGSDVNGPWGAGPWGAGPWGSDSWAAGPWGAGSLGAGPWGAGSWGAGPWGAGSWGAGPWGADGCGCGALGYSNSVLAGPNRAGCGAALI